MCCEITFISVFPPNKGILNILFKTPTNSLHPSAFFCSKKECDVIFSTKKDVAFAEVKINL